MRLRRVYIITLVTCSELLCSCPLPPPRMAFPHSIIASEDDDLQPLGLHLGPLLQGRAAEPPMIDMVVVLVQGPHPVNLGDVARNDSEDPGYRSVVETKLDGPLGGWWDALVKQRRP